MDGSQLAVGEGRETGRRIWESKEAEGNRVSRGRGQRKNFVSLLGLDTFAILFLFSKK